MTARFNSTLGRLCLSPERAGKYVKTDFARKITEVWRFDASSRTYAGATDGVVMALIECDDGAKLPCGPDEALSIASALLWTRRPKGRMLHQDLLAWAKLCAKRRRSCAPVSVFGRAIDAVLLALVLEVVPDRGDVRLRPGAGLNGHFLDLCGRGWAARIMGNMGHGTIALPDDMIEAP